MSNNNMKRILFTLSLLVATALAQTNPTNNFHFGRPVHNAGPGWGLELNTNSATIDSLWNNIISGCPADGLHAITWDPITHFNCTTISGGGGSGVWGGITGILSNQIDLQNALNLKSNLIAPAFSGFPTASTAPNGTNNNIIATTQFVINQIGVAGGVASWDGRVGAVVPTVGDYTFSQIGATPTTLGGYGITDAVPVTRTVAGHALSGNISIAFADIITTPTTLAGYGITDAVPGSRTVNGKALTANITLDLSSSDFAGQTLAAGRMPAMTGDCTTSAGTVALTCVKINGNSVPSGAAAHQMLVATGASAFALKTLPDCNGGSNAMNYATSTDVWSCLSITTLTNPLTTTGDLIYAVGAVPTRLAGPTATDSVPQVLTSTPSGGVATAPVWSVAGAAIDPRTTTTEVIVATDRGRLVTFNNGGAVAASIAQAGTTGFATNFFTVVQNLGAGAVTITPATSTINGAATLVLNQGDHCTIYSDNTNYRARCAPGQITAGSSKITLTRSASGVAIDAGAATTQTIASGTSALGTSAISSATCATVVTTTATGTATTDVVTAGFNGDPTAVTGYIPLTAGMLTIIAYPTTNNVNFKVCNNTTSSITPGAITLNWRVVR